jgi:aryl-alcohol dehydrogenase-like predicted oxidoreductase
MGGLKQQAAGALVRTAFDAGINFFDTADVYANGISEEITGQALRDLGVGREEYVIATKVFGVMGKSPNEQGCSRSHILSAAEASLRRLNLGHIDLYQIHGFDPHVPIEEQLKALDILVKRGSVRYIGVSNWAAWQIMKGLGISERLGLADFVSLQAYYTIAGRDLERELAPLLQSEGVGLMVWSPLAGGLLSGKYQTDSSATGRRAGFDFPPVDRPRTDAVINAMRPIAEQHGVSVAQIAIAWLLHQKVVTSVIIGARREDQLLDNIAATQVQLSPEELETLDKISELPREYPGWMIDYQNARRPHRRLPRQRAE